MKIKKNNFLTLLFNLKFLLLILVSSISVISTYSINIEIPKYTDLYVNDFSDILTVDDETYLKQIYFAIENETTAEVVFVSIPICSPLEPSQYAQEIGDNWKVGKDGKDNGLIILYCKDVKKIWIATGYGLEGVLPDSKIGRLLDETYVLYRDANQTGEGIVQFSEEIALVLSENKEELMQTENLMSEDKKTIILYLVPAVIIFIMLITQIVHFVNTQKMYNMKYSLDIIFWISVISYYFLGIALEIIVMFVIYYIMARVFMTGDFSSGKGGGGNIGGFGGGGFSGGSFGGGSFGGGGAGR